MPLTFNQRHLAEKNLHLQGELTGAELELDAIDEVIHVREPLRYDLEVQEMEGSFLVQGRLLLALDCDCVRCLKPFKLVIDLPDWVCHLPLEGEDKVSVVNDCVDLTPYIREDTVLAFPQHPLCDPDCGGLDKTQDKPGKSPGTERKPEADSSAWSALDKLKL
jgi:uncharacterized metal-binding protein YceD (DUF177 family)